jgi:uncharacterized protein (TIGR03437 family)
MQKKRKIFWGKTAIILGAIPFLMWAYEFGPDAGHCGVPKEGGTCLAAGCHTGTLNGSGGSVAVSLAGGTTYAPGEKQHLTVTISDSAATQRAWGFQLTVREESDTAKMAGSLASTDARTQLMCATSDLSGQRPVAFSAGGAQACPSNMPLQYIEHSLTGYQSTLGQTGSTTYEFDWTPPATAVGNVTIYVAANAGPAVLTQTNAHIYTKQITVTPAAAGGTPPAIQPGGVVSNANFGGFAAIAPGTWVDIYGTNLSTSTRLWAGSDFSGNTAPTSLDGVNVTIGGKPAFVEYISPTQVNIQAPSDAPTGATQMTVTNSAGTSAAYDITVNDAQPGLLAPAAFNIGGKQYVVAQHTDNSFVLPAGAISGVSTTPAKPGETVVIYGIGFGPAKDTSNATIPAGQIVTAANSLVNSLQMQVNNVNANLAYAGLAPNFVGLYQFNLVVPAVADGDWPLTFTLNGVKGSQTLYLSVHQ